LWLAFRSKFTLTFTACIDKRTQVSLDANRLFVNGRHVYTSQENVTWYKVKGRRVTLNDKSFYVLGNVFFAE